MQELAGIRIGQDGDHGPALGDALGSGHRRVRAADAGLDMSWVEQRGDHAVRREVEGQATGSRVRCRTQPAAA